MGRLIVLHSSIDQTEVQLLSRLALRDSWETDLLPWVDAPDPRDDDIGTLTATEPVDVQIADAISAADVILYIVGSTGLGRYQREVEAPLLERVLEERRAEGRPIDFVPVLLPEGRASDLPEWARAYTVVNHDRSARSSPALWGKIKQRLAGPAETGEVGGKSAAPERGDAQPPEWHEDVDRLVESLLEPPRLTVFIGPYSLESRDRTPRGPTALSKRLLNEIEIDSSKMPILPWPSEAAQWVMFRRTRPHVQKLMRDLFAPLGTNPSDLARSIAELSRRWIERFSDRPQQGWHGLLLLTTRTDLALESALTRIAREDFTRILPTLSGASQAGRRRQMVQQWQADQNWDALPDHLEREPRRPQLTDVFPTDIDSLTNFTMDSCKRIVLVKLCGSIDVPESLILTAYDFFRNVENFGKLPSGINEIIGASAHLFLGRGFASPLAQLIRYNVLKESGDWPRLWVVDDADDDPDPDTLCQLELQLLKSVDRSRHQSMEPLKNTRVCWAPEDAFVDRLAEKL